MACACAPILAFTLAFACAAGEGRRAKAGPAVALSAPQAKFLAGEIARMKKEGYSVKRRVLAPSTDDGALAVCVFRGGSRDYDQLKVWHLKGNVARLIYLEPGSSFRIELDALHRHGRLPDLYGDGTRCLAYTTAGLGSSMLHLVRFKGRAPLVEGTALPRGLLEDLEGDGRLEVLTRFLPLGPLYRVECGAFSTRAAQNGFQTAVYEWEGGRLVAASERHPAWFDADIARLEGEIASMDLRASRRYGDYLGAALAIYFDHAAKGLARQGWRRLLELLRSAEGAPPGTGPCIEQVKADLRRRLSVPDDW